MSNIEKVIVILNEINQSKLSDNRKNILTKIFLRDILIEAFKAGAETMREWAKLACLRITEDPGPGSFSFREGIQNGAGGCHDAIDDIDLRDLYKDEPTNRASSSNPGL